jgi:glycosyltransferase involved in cell wall biosynthesis
MNRHHEVEILPGAVRVSVIVAAYNQEALIRQLLEALAAQTWRDTIEIVVADNNSTDRTSDVARSYIGQIRGLAVIHAGRKQGQCAARNDAVQLSTGDLLLFVDGDDVPAADWVEQMVSAAARFDLVGGRLEVHELNQPEAVSRRPDPSGGGLTRLGFCALPYAVGTNFGISRAAFYDIGPWDESYTGGGEDAKICWTAQLNGYTIGAAPDAVVHYRLRSSLRELLRQTYGYGRAHARLRRDFREPVTTRPSVRAAAGRVFQIIWRVQMVVRGRELREGYFQLLALTAGQLRGSIESKVLVL